MSIRMPLSYVVKKTEGNICQAFKKANIVPEIINKTPAKLLEVRYDKTFGTGAKLNPKSVLEKPTRLRWEPVNYNKLHTLVMTEPDSPMRSDRNHRELLHWLVVNIRGDLVFNGDTLAEYVGVTPPEDTGYHKYVFLVFKQKNIIDMSQESYLNDKTWRGRNNFSISYFQNKHELSDAIAGNFFLSEYDDSVPELNKKMEIGEKELFEQERKAALIRTTAIIEKRRQAKRNK